MCTLIVVQFLAWMHMLSYPSVQVALTAEQTAMHTMGLHSKCSSWLWSPSLAGQEGVYGCYWLQLPTLGLSRKAGGFWPLTYGEEIGNSFMVRRQVTMKEFRSRTAISAFCVCCQNASRLCDEARRGLPAVQAGLQGSKQDPSDARQ